MSKTPWLRVFLKKKKKEKRENIKVYRGYYNLFYEGSLLKT